MQYFEKLTFLPTSPASDQLSIFISRLAESVMAGVPLWPGFPRLPQSMGEKWNASLLGETQSKHSQTSSYRKTLHPKSEHCDQWPLSCRQGHSRSWKVTNSFSAITFDRDQLEQWKHKSCAQADDVDRMIATWPIGTRSWPWLVVKFSAWLSRSTYGSFDASQQEKHGDTKVNVVPLLSQKLLQKNTFFHKNGSFCSFFFSSLEAKPFCLDQIWGHVSKRAWRELSNTFFHGAVAPLVSKLCADV